MSIACLYKGEPWRIDMAYLGVVDTLDTDGNPLKAHLTRFSIDSDVRANCAIEAQVLYLVPEAQRDSFIKAERTAFLEGVGVTNVQWGHAP